MQGSTVTPQLAAGSRSRTSVFAQGMVDVAPGAATLRSGASAARIAANLSDISEGEEEPATRLDGAAFRADDLAVRQLVPGGLPSADGWARDGDGEVTPPEPVKRCRSPGSNNAVPWRPTALRAAVQPSRRDQGG